MKKVILFSMIMLVLCFSHIGINKVYAKGETKIGITVEDNKTEVQKGEVFKVLVSAEEAIDLFGLQLTLDYDPSFIQIVEGGINIESNMGLFGGQIEDMEEGSLTYPLINKKSSKDKIKNLPILDISFKALKEGPVTLTLSNIKAVNSDIREIHYNTQHQTAFNIKAAAVTPPKDNAEKPSTPGTTTPPKDNTNNPGESIGAKTEKDYHESAGENPKKKDSTELAKSEEKASSKDGLAENIQSDGVKASAKQGDTANSGLFSGASGTPSEGANVSDRKTDKGSKTSSAQKDDGSSEEIDEVTASQAKVSDSQSKEAVANDSFEAKSQINILIMIVIGFLTLLATAVGYKIIKKNRKTSNKDKNIA